MIRNWVQMFVNQSKQGLFFFEKECVFIFVLVIRVKVCGFEDDDVQVQYLCKCCFQCFIQQLQQQLNMFMQQMWEVIQQMLVVIVDVIKLDVIEFYYSDRVNFYFEYLQIRKKIEEKCKILCCIMLQVFQCYVEYVIYMGFYFLDGKLFSKFYIFVIVFFFFFGGVFEGVVQVVGGCLGKVVFIVQY